MVSYANKHCKKVFRKMLSEQSFCVNDSMTLQKQKLLPGGKHKAKSFYQTDDFCFSFHSHWD